MTAFALFLLLLAAGVAADLSGSEDGRSDDVDQRAVLLDFKAGMTNWEVMAASRNFIGWSACVPGGECIPVCRWTGVFCDPYLYAAANEVTTLNLGCSEPEGCAVRLAGTLSPRLATLPHLHILDLSGNALNGTLPPEWGAKGTFKDLQILRLHGNKFTGRIPQVWADGGGFQEIVEFQVSDNQLTGPFPAVAWTNTSFYKMQAFLIGGNRMDGPLPEFWNGLIILGLVSISNNAFTGTIPPDWGRQGYFFNGTYNDTQALRYLYMHGNRLTGGLPTAWAGAGSFTALSELTLSENPLGGSLPMEWGLGPDAFPSLHSINLSTTSLTGTLPTQWGTDSGLASLANLNVAGNSLTGAVPDCWGDQLPNLERVTMQPGNPGLCSEQPQGVGFALCAEGDMLCYGQLAPSANASACTDADAGGGGSSFPVAAVAVPVALVGAAALAGAAWWLLRRRRQQEQRKVALALPQQQPPGRELAQQISTVSKAGSELQEEPSLTLAASSKSPAPFAASQATSAASGTPLSSPGQPAAKPGWLCFPCGRSGSSDVLQEVPSEGTAASSGAPPPWAQPQQQQQGTQAPATTVELSPLQQYHQQQQQQQQQQQAAGRGAPPLAPLLAIQQASGQAPAMPLAGLSQYQQQQAAFHSAPLSPMHLYEQQQAQFYSAPLMPSQHLPSLAGQLGTGPGGLQHSSSGRSGGPPSGGGGTLSRRVSLAGPDSSGPASGVAGPASAGAGSGGPYSSGSGGGIGAATGAAYHSSFGPRELDILMRDWDIPPESIQVCKRPDGSDWRIGSGGFGTVFKAMRNGVQPVAVKVIQGAGGGAEGMLGNEDFAREVSILRTCRDTNILQFQGVCFQAGRTLLVTEYMEGGNLAHNLRAKTVCWHRRGKKVAVDVARALVYLHSRRILHLDIKSANVLLTRDGTAKLGDVGMARIMAGEYVSGSVGTLAWSAPELLLGQRCDAKADVYSFGVLLWEIVTGEVPIRGQLRDPVIPDECPPEVSALIDRCTAHDPAERPTSVELVEALQRCPAVPPPGAALPRRSIGSFGPAGSGSLGALGGLPPRGSDAAPGAGASRAASLDGGPAGLPPPSRPPARVPSDAAGALPPLREAPGGAAPPSPPEPQLPEPPAAAPQDAQPPRSGGSSVDMRGPFAAVANLQRQFSSPHSADGASVGSGTERSASRRLSGELARGARPHDAG